jgi:hypothetical protein
MASTTPVQLKSSRVYLKFSSNLTGITKKHDVTQSHITAIHPMGYEKLPKLKVLILKEPLDTVSLKKMGIA